MVWIILKRINHYHLDTSLYTIPFVQLHTCMYTVNVCTYTVPMNIQSTYVCMYVQSTYICTYAHTQHPSTQYQCTYDCTQHPSTQWVYTYVCFHILHKMYSSVILYILRTYVHILYTLYTGHATESCTYVPRLYTLYYFRFVSCTAEEDEAFRHLVTTVGKKTQERPLDDAEVVKLTRSILHVDTGICTRAETILYVYQYTVSIYSNTQFCNMEQ